MNIARVFPRQTEATPDDELSFINVPPPMDEVLKMLPDFEEVHISVTYTYDLKQADFLEYAWRQRGFKTKMGGPAFGKPSGEFTPGMYLKKGYTITSRGCPNSCWFCSVPKREGKLREYTIKDGFNVTDDNLLACSDRHIKAVFEMLKRQNEKPTFTGGLEAKILKEWHVSEMTKLKPSRMFFAYDTPDDLEPLIEAGKLLNRYGYGLKKRVASCYVLIGYQKDTFEKAEKRLNEAMDAGFVPYAMLYRNNKGVEKEEWKPFQREWCNPVIVGTKVTKFLKRGSL